MKYNNRVGVIQKSRIFFVFVVFIVFGIMLIFRVGWLQIIRGGELTRKAIEQQTGDKLIMSSRGYIYDRNKKTLAMSADAERLVATSAQIKKSGKQDLIADGLAPIIGVDRDTIYKKITQNTYGVDLKRKIEKPEADKIRDFIRQNKISGLDLVKDVVRYYPYGNFASQVIGFVGTDNQGLGGIEKVFDDELKGEPGRIVSTKNAAGGEMPLKYKKYINPKDGLSLVLTIDESIQHFVEKHLESAAIENKINCGAAAIVVDVKTGEILAMATYPGYDLNTPFDITPEIEEKNPGIKDELAKLDGTEYNKRVMEVIEPAWRNKAVVDSYEPGSTFKMATTAAALEEQVVHLDEPFFCSGSIKVGPHNIHCWKRIGHGPQTFLTAVQTSCNPVFIQVSARIGSQKFYDYIKSFGFMRKTNIELSGETSGIFFSPDQYNEVQLATSSFGQGFQVTPLQMVTFASALANDGKMMKPHVVKELLNSNGGVVKTFEPTMVRQVVSTETSKTLKSVLESVVRDGGAKNAYVPGFRIAGKTGTSEKLPRGSRKYISSFCGFAPADDPKIALLLMLDEPMGDYYYGGVVAAPVAKNIFEDTLRYLNVEPKYTEEELKNVDIEVPNLIGLSQADATAVCQKVGIKAKILGSGGTIVNQIPKFHDKVASNSTVIAYLDTAQAQQKIVKVPNVVGMNPSNANKALIDSGLNVKINGSGSYTGTVVCSGQSVLAGTEVDAGTVVVLDFKCTDRMD